MEFSRLDVLEPLTNDCTRPVRRADTTSITREPDLLHLRVRHDGRMIAGRDGWLAQGGGRHRSDGWGVGLHTEVNGVV